MGTSPPNSEWFDEEKIVSNPLALILGCRIRLYNFFNFSLFRQGLYIEKKIINNKLYYSKLVHRRKGPKVDALFSSSFSDASERRV